MFNQNLRRKTLSWKDQRLLQFSPGCCIANLRLFHTVRIERAEFHYHRQNTRNSFLPCTLQSNMKKLLIKTLAFTKGLVWVMRPHILLGWLRLPLLTISNVLSISKWISQQDKKSILNDFYSPKRNLAKRYELYQYVAEKLNLKNEAIDYLEFGVSGGFSFKWWVNNCSNSNSKFYGFDTFEGLPEKWAMHGKGDMAANIPNITDTRVEFVKGLFQDTLLPFLSAAKFQQEKRKIIHLDADLFSSTLFVLTSLAPYLKKGDILFLMNLPCLTTSFLLSKCLPMLFM